MEQTIAARRDMLAGLARCDLDEGGCCHECYAAMEPSEHGEFVRFDSVIPIAGALAAAEAERDRWIHQHEVDADEIQTLRSERDRLAAALRECETEAQLRSQQLHHQRLRSYEKGGDGQFGIAVATDENALAWQQLDEAIQDILARRRAALHPQQEPSDG